MNFKVRGLFSFKGRSFKVSFLKWRERQWRGAALRYYLDKPREDTRTVFGKRVDTLGGLLMAWLVSFLLLANLTGRPDVALALSVPLWAAETLLLKKLWATREKRRRLRQQFWRAGQRFMDDILKMDSQKEFKPYVRDILAGLPGFEEIKIKSERKNGKTGDGQGIDLEGVYRGAPLAVRCMRLEGDKAVVPDDIRAFAGALLFGGFNNGFFITTGEYGAGVSRMVKEAARKGIKIKLINRFGLMDLARQDGYAAFQSEETAPGEPPRTLGERWAAALAAFLDSAFGSRRKIKNYCLYGLLLYGGYVLLKGSTLLSLVYLFFAVLNFLMAACCLYFGTASGETELLEGLEPEK